MKKPVLVLATGNDKKRRELEQMTKTYVVRNLRDVGLQDLEIIEDEETFAGNAEKKARTVLFALADRGALDGVAAVLADDSGLCVDALDGRPGVRSARFASDHAAGDGDEANNRLLLTRLEAVDDADRTARFACAICVALPGGRVLDAWGTVEGRIGREPRGDGGFGYDPLFWPDDRPGFTTAELPAAEKHAISHRGRAVRIALEKLEATLAKRP